MDKKIIDLVKKGFEVSIRKEINMYRIQLRYTLKKVYKIEQYLPIHHFNSSDVTSCLTYCEGQINAEILKTK